MTKPQRKPVLNFASRFAIFISSALITGAFTHQALADVLAIGDVEPASVTTGYIAEPLLIGDTDGSGSVTVNGGATLTVDNGLGDIGILLSRFTSRLDITEASTVRSTARNALVVRGDGLVSVNDGSHLALYGSSRGMVIGSGADNGTVSVIGAGTSIEIVGRLNIASTTYGPTFPPISNNGILFVGNGASVSHISTGLSLSTSFVIGANGGNGQLGVVSGSKMMSLVPIVKIGSRKGSSALAPGKGVLQVHDSSLFQVTAALIVGEQGGGAEIWVTDSIVKVLADPAAPVPETGSMFIGFGRSSRPGTEAGVRVSRGVLEIARSLFVATGDDPSTASHLRLDGGAIGLVGDFLYISHDGASNVDQGTGFVSICDSVMFVPETLVGQNGTLGGGGPSGVANITGNVTIDGGNIAPGCSPGELTVDGNVNLLDGKLIIEVFRPDLFDILTILGDIDFQSGKVIFSFKNGYGPTTGDNFIFLDANQIDGFENLSFEFEGLQDGFDFHVDESATDVKFTAITDGTPEFVSPLIDIRPGEPNEVNPTSNQLIPVAILTTQDAPIFDAGGVDPSTVAFGPAGASPDPVKIKLKDVDEDGDLDLRLWFRVRETGIACGDTIAQLTGLTFDGTEITASDEVQILGCE